MRGDAMVILVARALATGLVLAFFALYFLAGQPFSNPYRGGDFDAYWQAAERVRNGAPLYPAGADAGLGFVYRYAPWFALAWVPFTAFPREAVLLVWQLTMLLAGLVLLWPLVRRRTLASLLLAAMTLPLVIDLAWVGNVEALMILGVAALIRRPIGGPIAVGLAASLKITPILFVAHYVAQRAWGSAVIAVGVTGILWLPAFAVGFADYPVAALPTIAIWGASPVAGAAVAVVVIAVTVWLALRRSRWSTLAAAVASLAASPVLFITSLPRLLVPVWAARKGDTE